MTEVVDEPTVAFDEHRKLLLGVAYRVLGQWSEAEDVVQDAWLRWREVDHDEVRNARSYLVQITTRLAIDRLRQAKTRRETYVGQWLPEPVLTDKHDLAPDVADRAALTDSVSIALLVVLETLSPLERAVFVLREAFDFSYAEIAEILDRTEPAVRQLASRARSHVEERRTRFDTDQRTQREVTEKFLAATLSGQVEELLGILAPDVELQSDGGGVVRSARRVIVGADKVARFLTGPGAAKSVPPEPGAYVANVNGKFALVLTSEGQPYGVLTVDARDGKVAGIQFLVSPTKLSGIQDIAEVGTPIDLPWPTG